jgi:hypothetical protein
MPRRAGAVDGRHRLALRVAAVASVVEAAVAQVELLVMRSAGSNSHVTQAFSARGVDLFTQVTVFLLAERETVQMRSPYQAFHDHAPPGRVSEYLRYLGAGTIKEFIGIAAPIGEHEHVTGIHRSN